MKQGNQISLPLVDGTAKKIKDMNFEEYSQLIHRLQIASGSTHDRGRLILINLVKTGYNKK